MAETPTGQRHKRVLGFGQNVFFLGVVSFLTDISSEMIFTLIPLFLSNVLGTATAIVGFVGGLSDATDALFRLFSGWYSDRIRRQKIFAVLGYGLAAVVKPLMYLAAAWGTVVAIRFTDRVGKGLRSTPRDALLASWLSPSERGKGFGFHRAMDTAGATLGLAIAAVIIYSIEGTALELSRQGFQRLVLIGTIPAILGVIVLLLFVHEKRDSQDGEAARRAVPAPFRAPLDARFKMYLGILALFTLGRGASDFFLILRAQNLEVPLVQVTLMLVLMNGTYALMSLPMGMLSDRMGRRRIIALGWFIYAIVYLGFALATHLWQAWLLFAGFGIYQGVAEGVSRAFVADLVPEGRRGTAYGLQQGLTGILILPAGVVAGYLWDRIAPSAPFYLGAGMAFAAVLGLLVLIKEPARKRHQGVN